MDIADMFAEQILININVACIVFWVVLLAVLAMANRMKDDAGWAALIVFGANISVMLVNLIRDVAPEYFLIFIYPAHTLNLLCYPALWFFVQKQMDKSFRLTPCRWLHALPALVSLGAHIIYYAPLSAEQVDAEIAIIKAGGKNIPGIINDTFLYIGLIVYIVLIICYIRRRMRYLRNHFSNSDYLKTHWAPRFIVVYFGVVFIAAVGYAINPLTDTWLIPVMNLTGMAYLLYCVIKFKAPPSPSEGGEQSPSFGGVRGGLLGEASMKEICDKVMNYLSTSGAYTDPDFSLAMLSVETGISNKNLSRSINKHLKKNFFDLINEMRIEKAKNKLRSKGNNFTIESVAVECGFHSRSAFYAAFKKAEGKTPTQWMKTLS